MGEPERRRRRLRPSHSTADSTALPDSSASGTTAADEAGVTSFPAVSPGVPADAAGTTSAGTASVETASVETASVETASVETASVETASVETGLVETGLVETGLVERVPGEVASVGTASVEDPAGEAARGQAPPAGTTPVDEARRKTRSGFAGRPRATPGDDREVERGLRGLVGSGSSQVSVGAALRARDAARPTDAQLAEAERELAIVRRNWTPREDLPRNR